MHRATWRKLIWVYLCFAFGARVKDITSAVSRQLRYAGFPDGSGMGIFFALGVPLGISDKSISVSSYFEANYGLDSSGNFTDHGQIQKRNLDRIIVYDMIESKLDGAGYPGRSCLLRSICEASENPINNSGLVGDIVQLIFTPSSSMNENISPHVREAEYANGCATRYNDCPISLLDLISEYDNQ